MTAARTSAHDPLVVLVQIGDSRLALDEKALQTALWRLRRKLAG